jgi:hypothetical protein
MTPTEKAKEMFDKMKGFRVKHTHSKKCALIAVDEILHLIKDIYCYDFDILNPYWQEVKEELLKNY